MTRRYLILLYKVVLGAQPKKYFTVSSVYDLVWSVVHISLMASACFMRIRRIFTYMLSVYNTVALKY